MEADRVVVELIAKVDGFDGKMKQSAGSFETEMGKIERAAGRAEKAAAGSFGNQAKASSAFAQTLKRGMLDVGSVLAGANSPFVLPVKQAPAVTGALKGISLGASALGGILGGALTLGAGMAVAALLELVKGTKSEEEQIADLITKLKEKYEATELNRRADEQWKKTIDGLVDSLSKESEELRKGLQGQRARLLERETDLQRRATDAKNEEIRALRALAAAQRELQAATDNRKGIRPGGEDAANRLASADARLERAKAQVARLREEATRASGAVKLASDAIDRVGISLNRLDVDEATNPIAKINGQFDRMRDAAEQAAIGNDTLRKALKATTIEIERQRQAALKAEQERQRAANAKPKGPSLPAVTGREIAAALGTSITSGTRTAAQNKAADGAANSYHLAGQAIDIPLTVNGKPLTKAGIRAALEPLGVEIKELLGPGDKGHNDHFHIAFGKKRLGPDQVASRSGRAAATAENAADAEERRLQTFQNELAALLGQEIDARQALVVSVAEIARLEAEAIEIARKKYNDNLASQVETERLTAEEAKQLQAINDERARLRTELVAQRESVRKFREQEEAARRADELAGAGRDIQMELLTNQAQMARTQAQRRDLELRILELQFQEEEMRLKYLIGYSERLQTQEGISDSEKAEAAAQAEIARLKLASIGQRKAGATAQVEQGTQGPLQSWADQIPQTADEMKEALEGVAVNGLDNLADSLTQVVMGTKTLGQAFSEMAMQILQEITQMIIKMLILKAIKMAIGGGFAEGGEVGAVPGFSVGGRIVGPGTGTSDSIPIRASAGEFIIKKRSVDRLGTDRLHYMNQTGRIPGYAKGGEVGRIRPSNASAVAPGSAMPAPSSGGVMFDLRGAVITEDLLRQMNQISMRNSIAAGRGAFEASRKDMPQRIDRLQRLGTS